jgi:hypothetical protein
MAAGAQQPTPQEVNAMQRAMVLANAVSMKQQIYSAVFTVAANANPINIPVRNVGLIKRFIVEVTATIPANTGGALSQLGLANILSNVQFQDLNNNIRINTDGVHLAALAHAKTRRPSQQTLSTVVADNNQMLQVGENFPVLAYASNTGGSQNLRAVFEVPLAYSDSDLRGGIYANVVNATMNLQLQILQNASVAAGVDSTYALYGNGAGLQTLTNITVTVYQEYLDQLPVDQTGRPVLPFLDLSTVYELKKTAFSSIVANQDFPIPYANFRDFLSTIVVFNSTGADAGCLNGSDVNYWALQSANFTNITKQDPLEIARQTRNLIQTDFTKGMYYFPSRNQPISTQQYGNMNLILNAKTASTPAYAIVYWEDFAFINTLTQASSLAG